jgi:dTMP kinase
MTEATPAVERGVLIVLEGQEYVGKSTQRDLLAERLRALGHDVVVTREIGGTPYAEKIRTLVLNTDRDGEHVSPLTEMLLAYAARSQHLEQVIAPALEAGKIVLTDRFVASTFCYQVWPYIDGNMQHGLLNMFMGLNGSVLSGIITEEPLVLIQTLNDEDWQARRRANNKPDIIESREVEFHAKVAAAYAQHAGAPNHHLVDGGREIQVINDELFQLVTDYLAATKIVRKQAAEARAAQAELTEAGISDMPPELAALMNQIQMAQPGDVHPGVKSYEEAQAEGFPGTEAEWVTYVSAMQQNALHGEPGNGTFDPEAERLITDYAEAKNLGFDGTEEEWQAYLAEQGINSTFAVPVQQKTIQENIDAYYDLAQRYDADPSQLTEGERKSVEEFRAKAKATMAEVTQVASTIDNVSAVFAPTLAELGMGVDDLSYETAQSKGFDGTREEWDEMLNKYVPADLNPNAAAAQ